MAAYDLLRMLQGIRAIHVHGARIRCQRIYWPSFSGYQETERGDARTSERETNHVAYLLQVGLCKLVQVREAFNVLPVLTCHL